MPIVSIPGKGMRVQFPDDMTPEQIEQAIQQEIYGPEPEQVDVVRKPMPQPPTEPERVDVVRRPMPEPPEEEPARVDVVRRPMPEPPTEPERVDVIRKPMPQPPGEPVQEKPANPVIETVKEAAAYVPYLAVKALHGATGWIFEPFQSIPTEKLTPMQKATVEALGGAEEVMETAVEWWKKQTGDLDVKIPDVTIGKNPDGSLAIKPTESSLRDIAERTAGLAGEALGPINASLTGGRLVAETLSKQARPFFRSIVSGMTAGALLGEGDKDQTLQNMALFGVLEPLAYTVGNVPRIAKKIQESQAWKKANTQERGLMLQSLDETIRRYPNLTEAEILRRWNNPQWREEALARRRVKPMEPEAPPQPPRPEGTVPAPPVRPERPVRPEEPVPPPEPVRPEEPVSPPAVAETSAEFKPVVEQEVWHGTPYVYRPEPGFPHGRPRLDMIGKGEGSAAYGWGWYSVDKPETAEWYQQQLSRAYVVDKDVVKADVESLTEYLRSKGISDYTARSFASSLIFSNDFPTSTFESIRRSGTMDPKDEEALRGIAENMEFAPRGRTVRIPGGLKAEAALTPEERSAYYDIQSRAYWYTTQADPIERVKKDFEQTIKAQSKSQAPEAKEILKRAEQGLEFIEKYKPYIFEPEVGSLYKLDIPDEVVPKLLDWDAPLKEQPEHVKRTINRHARMIEQALGRPLSEVRDTLTGGDLYKALADRLSGQKEASEYLRSIGIPGNVHGGLSRGETGTKYVLWDQDVLDQVALLERNKKALEALQTGETPRPITPAQREVSTVVDTYSKDLVSTKTQRPVGREGAGIETVTNAIASEFKRVGRIDLRGKKIQSSEDLAVLAQMFRDPRVESFRVFYVNDAGEIVSHEGVSCRMPDTSAPFVTDFDRGVAEMKQKMERVGATGYYALHNHPSGSPKPSQADLRTTERLAREIPGFKGHVVIDSGKYAVLSVDPQTGKVKAEIHKLPNLPSDWRDPLLTPSKPHPLMKKYIADAKDLAEIGKALKRPKDHTTLIFRSSNGDVRAIQNVPNGLLKRTDQGSGYITNRAREFGSPQVFAYFEDPGLSDTIKHYVEKGYLFDAVFKGAEPGMRGKEATPEYGMRFGQRQIPAAVRVAEEWKPIPEGLRRSAILKKLSDTLGVPIRIGKFKTRRGAYRVKGIYKPRAKVIRLAAANDLETALHEVGHHIETLLGLPKRMPDEIRALAYAGAKNPDREGFAEFVRYYVINPTVARGAHPEFTAMFEEALKMHPEVRDVLLEAKQAWKAWQESDAVAKIGSFIQRGQRRGRMPSINRVYTEMKDALYPLKQVTDLAEDISGFPVRPSEDPYMLARLTRGWHRMAEQFLKYQPFRYDPDEGVVFEGKPLREILRPVDEAGDLDLLDRYLVAKRASADKRIVKGFKDLLTQEDFDQAVAELEPRFGAVAEELYQYSDRLLDFLVDSGRISDTLADTLRKKNMFYAPLYRVMDWEPPMGGLSSRKFSSIFNPIKRLKGSPRDIYSPTESLLYNTYVMINAATRNRVGRALMELSKRPGMGKLIEAIPPRIKPVKMTAQEAINSLIRGIEDEGEREAMKQMLSSLPKDALNEMVTTFRPDYTPKANEALFYEAGEPRLFELDPVLARAISNISASDLGTLTKIAAFPAQTLRAGATAFNPDFPLPNLMRDQLTAFIQSKYGFVPMWDFTRGLFHILGRTETWQRFNASGAAHSAQVSIDRNYISKNLKDMFERGTIKGEVKHPLRLIQALSEAAEEATRVGEFARAQKRLGPDYEALLQSGMAGREVTMDFARQGEAVARTVNLLSAFWNARLEGIDKMVRTFKTHPERASAMAFLGVTVPSVLLWYAQKDDPYYQELPTWRRVLCWNIVMHNEDGTLNRIIPIPKPFEYGLLFGSFPEMALDWAYTDDPEGFKEAAKSALKTLELIPIPTWLTILTEWWTGKSYFFDRPIVPRSKEILKPVLQYGPHTSKTMRLIAEAFDKVPGLREVASPAKLENLTRGFLGGGGSFALLAGDYLVEALDLGDMPKAPAGKFTIPGLKSFKARYPSANTRSIETFYKRYHKLTREWESTPLRMAVRGTGIRTDLPPELAMYRQAASAMNVLRHMIDIAYESRDLTPEEKRQALDNYYEAMINVARATLGKKPMPQRKQ